MLALGAPAWAQNKPDTNASPASPKKEQTAKTKKSTKPDSSQKKAETPKPEAAKDAKEDARSKDPMSSGTFSGLRLRSIGPAFTSGRIAAFAVNPESRAEYYVAVASGGVWKTTNAGTTYTPVFDNQGSYSIGAVTIDPSNTSTVWVGTGENNAQRSVGWGDGVYKSEDGGKSWKNMGLKKSEHIGRILVDPRDSNTVYVAAQGPLWGPGGDRGLFKTTDGGKTWKNILQISDNTGVTDIALDPSNPDTIYAAAWQRRRHVFTMIAGGPESAFYKSTDAGATFRKITAGLPNGEDIGRIGIAVSPAEPNIVYLQMEAANGRGGIFRSTDRGASFERRNSANEPGMYYARIIADPKNPDRIYIMNVVPEVSDDGGRTLQRMSIRSVHVDIHDLWIDPKDTNYYLLGGDGGVYESFNRGENWAFKPNLPVTQFYDVAVDNSKPFYYVYGGTQDNSSMGGPSRTRNTTGIANSDWFITTGGDGFHSRVDPTDPNTVYAESQHGYLVRYDRRTGQSVGIQPKEGAGEAPLRWNWDSPLIISPHSHTRLYFAANRLFRSDDRGNTWKPISGDLTRQINKNALPVMGVVWPADAVAKSTSTSFYGNIVALTESPKKEDVVYVGTDDGLIQMTDDAGQHWTKYETFPGVPEKTYVSRLFASSHDASTVYASFENHKNADFKPYLLKSTDKGKTWTSISSNLPENGPVLAFTEDPVNPNLLFAGTEFGLFFTIDGGKKWTQLKGGLPTIAVRDLVIHPREGDLVAATFGRGFYILDDITPLRVLKPEMLAQAATIFPVKDTPLYMQARPQGQQGESFYSADNPPYGVVLTYYLNESLRSKKDLRHEAEREAAKKGQAPPYPTAEDFHAEEEEIPPALYFTVYDASGKAVRNVPVSGSKGLHRVTWNFRGASLEVASGPSRGGEDQGASRRGSGGGIIAMPGKYTARLFKSVNGTITELGTPVNFTVYTDEASSMKSEELAKLNEFQQKAARLSVAVGGAVQTANQTKTRLGAIRRALAEAPNADPRLLNMLDQLEGRLNMIQRNLTGDRVMETRQEPVPPSIQERVGSVMGNTRFSMNPPTQTDLDGYAIASKEFAQELEKLRTLVEVDLKKLEQGLDTAGAPWTPGRMPEWKSEQ